MPSWFLLNRRATHPAATTISFTIPTTRKNRAISGGLNPIMPSASRKTGTLWAATRVPTKSTANRSSNSGGPRLEVALEHHRRFRATLAGPPRNPRFRELVGDSFRQIKKQNAEDDVNGEKLDAFDPVGFAVAADLKQDVNRSDYGEDFRPREFEVHRLAKQIGDE